MAQWSPIDPDDVVDLWFDWGDASRPFLPTAENIETALVTVPDGFVKLTESIEGQMVRFRLNPGPPGKYDVGCHIITDAGQEFDLTNTLIVKERVKK